MCNPMPPSSKPSSRRLRSDARQHTLPTSNTVKNARNMMRFCAHMTFIHCASRTLAIPAGIRFVSRRRRVLPTTCQHLYASHLRSRSSHMDGMAVSCFSISALMDGGTSAFLPAQFRSDAQSLLSCGTWSKPGRSWPIVTTAQMNCFTLLSIGQMRPTLSNQVAGAHRRPCGYPGQVGRS